MDSPLRPLFANIFMDHFEQKQMEAPTNLGVTNWMRYVDYVFATIKDESCATKILEFLNTQHQNIRFTIEMELNNKIPFLKNEYPEQIINQEIEQFITNRTKQLQQQASTTATTTNNQQPPTIENRKNTLFYLTAM
jgi:hypothetical protein